MIRLENVNKYFFKDDPREVHALRDINLEIKKGEFSALIGPSGCGKTTLLNAIGALDSITSGKIYLEDKEITALNEKETTQLRLNEMGFVFQAYNLVPVLNVAENIAFIMKLRGFPQSKIEMRVKEVATLLEIDHKLDALPNTLSGGQQQRVAVARAVASKPKIILADEPTANLDSKSTSNLLDMMAKMNKDENATFVFSTHDQRVIDKARRVITLEDGKIVSDETR